LTNAVHAKDVIAATQQAKFAIVLKNKFEANCTRIVLRFAREIGQLGSGRRNGRRGNRVTVIARVAFQTSATSEEFARNTIWLRIFFFFLRRLVWGKEKEKQKKGEPVET
jgi:hypothetical protein